MINLLAKLLRYSFVMLSILCMSCAHQNSGWLLSGSCSQLASDASYRYKLDFESEKAGSQLLILVNQWKSGVLNSVALNPMGVKVFSSTWNNETFNIEVNPLFKNTDFSILVQGVVLSEWVIPASASDLANKKSDCFALSSLQYLTTAKDRLFKRGDKELMSIDLQGEGTVQLLFPSRGYTLNYRRLD